MAKNTERVCIHCGEVVKENVDICPYCGLSVENTAQTGNTDFSKEIKKANENNITKKSTKKSSDGGQIKIIAMGLSILILVAIVIAIILSGRTSAPIDKKINGTVTTKEELNKKFDVDIKEPVEAKDVNYLVENENIAKQTYKKTVSGGNVMDFVLRVSSSTEDIENSIGLTDSKGQDVEFAYTPIMMTVICEDGSEIQVESKVALETNEANDENQEARMKYMRALWMDNDKYYSMVTDNLVTREDFLQEVNRVIIANHEAFEDSEEETTN